MHPGFAVYNPETLLRLRDAVGPEIGANFDPSHLFWQGIDAPAAIREIGKAGAMHHFHAKDTRVDVANTRVNGVLDTKPYTDEINRFLDISFARLRKRPRRVEGHDQRASAHRLRRRSEHRARRQFDVAERGP